MTSTPIWQLVVGLQDLAQHPISKGVFAVSFHRVHSELIDSSWMSFFLIVWWWHFILDEATQWPFATEKCESTYLVPNLSGKGPLCSHFQTNIILISWCVYCVMVSIASMCYWALTFTLTAIALGLHRFLVKRPILVRSCKPIITHQARRVA